jgi:glycosyltransferase involved in cell wall biosynthesis
LKAQGLDVTSIGPLTNNFHQIGRIKGRLYRHLFLRSYDFQRSAILGYDYARQLKKQLEKCACDIVFSPSTIPISRLRCRQPIAIWVDATWASYVLLYKIAPPWCDETIRAGHITERLAYDRCRLLIFSSQWAAESAIRDYGVDPKKVRIIPFGANFAIQIDRERALRSISERPTDLCKLITIGVDWDRKGIPRSIELAAALNRDGQPTELTIVGCVAPPSTRLPRFVKIEGFIDKSNPEGERRLSSLLLQSHFHVLFSTAEAFGVVFAEANAHAVPNITWDVGGIASAVVNDKGGRCFSPQYPIADIAAYIKQHTIDRDRYEVLALAARREYEERLNWAVSGRVVKEALETMIKSSSG